MFPFCLHLFLRTFSAAQPFLLQQVNNQLVRDFLSQQNTRRFFFLSLWIYLWLAETSQQSISQTTWLKVTPHCNHCKYYKQERNNNYILIAKGTSEGALMQTTGLTVARLTDGFICKLCCTLERKKMRHQ